MSWLFSQALVEAYSEESFSDGEPSAPSNSTPTPQAYLWRDKTTDAWTRFPSGMTLQPLTESHGEDVLTSFLEAFPVKISVVRERAQESTGRKAGSGEKWQGSFAKYDQDTSLWRTHQCSLLGDFTEFSETWPRWGSMHNGACWERTMLVPTTDVKESGLWPTPVASDWQNRSTKYAQGGTSLTVAVKMWPTPLAGDARGAAPNQNTVSLGRSIRRSEGSGKLNPTWVAWLMGWPLGWTDLSVSAMDKYQQWLQLHSGYLERGGQHDTRRIQYKRNTKRELHPNHAREAR